MDSPPDDTGQPPTNVLPFLLAPLSPSSFVNVSDAITMSCSEDDINKKIRLSRKRVRKERHRTSKLNITVNSQSTSLNNVPCFPYLSNIGPTHPSPATLSDSTSPSTKSIGRLEYNNNDIGPFIIHCQRIEVSPSAGSELYPVSFAEIL
ncbi:hypothetical protein EVAR_90736_1 [Eumeta japonica]|uniref:Uncharacterized protein n=1 Tax=Eumeta variegata TaxID=151549 RepID=A0A4C1ZTG4_EUMVA|nr:hypothetical protein EVAR_90736_1 [Eumeta japonica]